jgi:hypothetical protein
MLPSQSSQDSFIQLFIVVLHCFEVWLVQRDLSILVINIATDIKRVDQLIYAPSGHKRASFWVAFS